MFFKGWCHPVGPFPLEGRLISSLSSRQMSLEASIRPSILKLSVHAETTNSSVEENQSHQLLARSPGWLQLVYCMVALDKSITKYPMSLFSFSCTVLTRRVVFPHCKRTIKRDETVRKCYVINRAEYCFGPLHCGKPREGYHDGRFPENMDIFNISNSGNMQANVQISLKNEQNLPTFILEPSTMTLEPGESQVRKSMAVKL